MNSQDLKQIDELLKKRFGEQDERNEKRFATKDDLKKLSTKDDLKSLEERIDQKFATKVDLKDMEERILTAMGEHGREILNAVNESKVDKREFEKLKKDVEKLKNN